MGQSEIAVYQPFHDEVSRRSVDAFATPINWLHNPAPELREAAIYLHIAENMPVSARYLGVFSPKFSMKSGISLEAFIEFVNANPGHDVYFINPFPHLTYRNFNVWDQGEIRHPGLIATARECFRLSSIFAPDVFDMRHDQRSAAFCNFWVATPAFFDHFVNMLSKLLSHCPKRLLFGKTIYTFRRTPIFPFVAERLFSSIVASNPAFSYSAYSFSLQQVLDRCGSPKEQDAIRQNTPWIDELDNHKLWTPQNRDKINELSLRMTSRSRQAIRRMCNKLLR